MKKSESGRTILEMIAVIVMVAILLMSSMAGYNFLVQRQQRNEAVKQVVTLVTALKTTEAAKKYAYRNVIPIKEVVSGEPRTEDGGKVLKLAGEDGYAAVHAMKEGGFLLTLQTKQATCDEILAALGKGYSDSVVGQKVGKTFETTPEAQKAWQAAKAKSDKDWQVVQNAGRLLLDNTSVDPDSVQYEKDLEGNFILDERGNKKIVMGVLNTKGTTTVKLSSLDRIACESVGGTANAFIPFPDCQDDWHLCDGVCQKCECGYKQDGNGECCLAEDMCSGSCTCPAGQIKVRENGACFCAECDGSKPQNVANAECVNRWQIMGIDDDDHNDEKWASHACDKGAYKCTECEYDSDCWVTAKWSPFFKRYGSDQSKYKYLSCENHRCVECTTSYLGEVILTQKHCPKEYPVCVEGSCRRCPMGYDPITKECYVATCDNEANCVGYKNKGYVANPNVEEFDDVYDEEGHIKPGKCEEACVPCYDSKPGKGVDAGCTEGNKPICMTRGDSVVSTGNNLVGDACAYCVNTDEKGTDLGCEDAASMCVGADFAAVDLNSAGTQCVQCLEHSDCGSGQKCTDHRCVQSCDSNGCNKLFDETEACIDDDCANACKVCQDDRSGGVEDLGCGRSGCSDNASKPLCEATIDGNGTKQYGDSCRLCRRHIDDDGVSEGCSLNAPLCEADNDRYGDECRRCQDTVAQDSNTSERDQGCPGYGDSDKKFICDTEAENNGAGAYGDVCVECLHSGHCPKETPKCDEKDCKTCREWNSDKPVWRAAEGAHGDCVFCMDTASGNNEDEGCGSDRFENAPLCVTRTEDMANWTNNGSRGAGTQCVFCFNDADGNGTDSGCGTGVNEGKPICVTSDNDQANWPTLAKNQPGTQCVECMTDDHCEKGICKGYQCVTCEDDQTDAGVDHGCDKGDYRGTDKYLCVLDEEGNDHSNWLNNGQKTTGTKCVRCYDSVDTTNNTAAYDEGCSMARPMCVGDDWANDGEKAEGTQCVFCFDSASGLTPDEGCNSDGSVTPICVDAARESSLWVSNGQNTIGTRCVQCYDDTHCSEVCNPSNYTCQTCAEFTKNERPVWRPVIKHEDGSEEAGQCVFCFDTSDNHISSTNDEGCVDSKTPVCLPKTTDVAWEDSGRSAVGEQCVFCADTAEGADRDAGCYEDARPICAVEVGSNGRRLIFANPGNKKQGTRCVQCLVDSDCPVKEGETVHCVSNYTCQYCIDDETGSTEEGMNVDSGCPNERPLCVVANQALFKNTGSKDGGAQCIKCYDSKTGIDTDEGCGVGNDDGKPLCVPEDIEKDWKNDGQKSVGAQCVKCFDSSAGINPDEGCNGEGSVTPICVDGSDRSTWVNEGTKTVGDRCVQCVADTDCAGKTDANGTLAPVCNPNNNTCVSCHTYTNGDRPVWNAFKKTCVYCNDDKAGEEADEGCPGSKYKSEKMCQQTEASTANGPDKEGNALPGGTCWLCRNNNHGDNNRTRDEGCTGDKPICEAAANAYSNTCHRCQDDQAGDGQDSGCPENANNPTPICVIEGIFDKTKKTGEYGDSCVTCYDDAEGSAQDTGCGVGVYKDKPVCFGHTKTETEYAEGKTGATGSVCYECITNINCDPKSDKPMCNPDTHTCEACHTGCQWNGTMCVCCKDDKAGSAQDTGCPLKEGDSARKMCMPYENPTGNGTGKYGQDCRLCRNNNTGAATDEGCPADNPLCEASENAYGNACHKCQDTSKQETSGSVADLGCPNTAKLCGTANTGDKSFHENCYECFDDNHCASSKPVCNTETNICFVCKDTNTDSNKDQGCGEGTWNDKPICDVGENTGNGKFGQSCFFCKDSASGAAQDIGCGTGDNVGKNLCVNGTDKTKWVSTGKQAEGTKCVQCLSNPDCANITDSTTGKSLPVCNAQNTCEACPDDKPYWNGSECAECLDDSHCPNNKYCETGRGVAGFCNFCNAEQTGLRCTNMQPTAMGCAETACRCPVNYTTCYQSLKSTNKGGNGGTWSCAPGCIQHTQCGENICCWVGDKQCTDETCSTTTLCENRGQCVAKAGWYRREDSTPCEHCDEECEEWDPDKGQCVSNGLCRCMVDADCGDCEVCTGHKCVYTCKDNQICAPKVGNAKQDVKTCGGMACMDVDCSKMVPLTGAVNAGSFFVPPSGKANQVTHVAAEKICEKCGAKLADLDTGCGKDYHYDTGHDCPNISKNSTFTANGKAYELKSWHVADTGSFWLNNHAKDGYYLRATYSCGNNHPEHGCLGFYPICYIGGAKSCPADAPFIEVTTKDCYVCKNTATGNNKDDGCGTGKWAGRPVCEAGTNGLGNSCACPSDKPYWDSSINACKECNGNRGSGAQYSCTTDAKPVCDNGTCVACSGGRSWNGTQCACPSNKPYWDGKTCKECNGNKGTGAAYACKTDAKPVCNNNGTCEACPSDKFWNGSACVECDGNKGSGATHACTTDTKPICSSGTCVACSSGKIWNGSQCIACSGGQVWNSSKKVCECPANQCLASNKKCIALNSYDDIERGSDGTCQCVAAVRTQDINDMGNSYSGEIDKDYGCYRLSTKRRRVYQIPVNFYCPRYMHVSDAAAADDFVQSSSPAGIGVNSNSVKSASWKYAHDNSISPRVSSATIQKGTAKLVVQDRWAAEVGFNGFFYFTTKKGEGSAGSRKLKATAGWASGHSKQGPTNGWLCKDGEGSSRKKKATGDAHCCR